MSAARGQECPLCGAPPGRPCQPKPEGDHLARYLEDFVTGKLPRWCMAAVLGELVVIDACAVIPAQRACGRPVWGDEEWPCGLPPGHGPVPSCPGGRPAAAAAPLPAPCGSYQPAEPYGPCTTCGRTREAHRLAARAASIDEGA